MPTLRRASWLAELRVADQRPAGEQRELHQVERDRPGAADDRDAAPHVGAARDHVAADHREDQRLAQ